MLSAPARIPAITVRSFGAGFAEPDLIRGVLIDRCGIVVDGKDFTAVRCCRL